MELDTTIWYENYEYMESSFSLWQKLKLDGNLLHITTSSMKLGFCKISNMI